MKQERPFWLIVAFVILAALSWQTPLPNLGGWGTALPSNLIIIVAAGLGILLFVNTLNKQETSIARASLPILALVTALLLTSLWAQWSSTTFDAVTVLLLCALVTDQVARLSHRSVLILLTTFVLCGAVQGLMGTSQLLLGNVATHIYRNVALNSGHVPTGTFQQVNVLSSFLAASYAAAGGVLGLKPPSQQRYSPTKLGIPAAIVLILAVVTAAGSRIGWISTTFVFVVTTVWLSAKLDASTGQKRQWISSTALGVLGGILISLFVDPVTSRVEDKLNTETARWEIYRVSLSLISDSPHRGHGAGSFERAYREKAAHLYHENPDSIQFLPEGRLSHPHNELLFWWVQSGWFIPLTMIIVATFYAWGIKDRNNPFRYTAAAIALPIVLHSNTELPLWQSLPHCLLLAVAAGLLGRQSGFITLRTSNSRLYTVKRVVFLTGGVLCIGLGCHGLLSNTILWNHRNDPQQHNHQLSWIGHPGLLQTTYDFEFNGALFNAGVQTGNTTALQMFRDWADEARYQYPTAQLYQGLIWSTYLLGDVSKAAVLRQEAEHLFPFASFDLPPKAPTKND